MATEYLKKQKQTKKQKSLHVHYIKLSVIVPLTITRVEHACADTFSFTLALALWFSLVL